MKNILSTIAIIISANFFAQKAPINLLPSGHIITKAVVEGHEGNFIFDTGGGINLFFDSFAKNLKQKTTYNSLTSFRATGEKLTVPVFQSEEVDFAGKKFKNIPYSTFNMKMSGIDGLISLQMFSDQDFIIDFDKKEIVLTDFSKTKPKKSFDIQLTTDADKTIDISTYVLLNDKYKIQVMLDSGAGNNSFWLNENLMSTLGIDKSKLQMKEYPSEFDPNIKTKMYRGTITSLSNQYVKLDNPTVVFVEGLIHEGKTSINWFGNKIGISLKNKKMYILD